MTDSLSPVQHNVLHFLRVYHAEHGYSPSVREVMLALHFRSTSSANHHLKVLQDKGYIRRDSMVSRGIVVLEQGSS